MYWRSPESGDFWYTSRRLKKTICGGGRFVRGSPTSFCFISSRHKSIRVVHFIDATILNSGWGGGDLFCWTVLLTLSSSCQRPGSGSWIVRSKRSCVVRSKTVFRCKTEHTIEFQSSWTSSIPWESGYGIWEVQAIWLQGPQSREAIINGDFRCRVQNLFFCVVGCIF